MKALLMIAALLACFAPVVAAQNESERVEIDARQGAPQEDVRAEKEPQILNYAEVLRQLQYPEHLKKKGIEGKVILRVLIDGQGKYVRHIVAESPHEDLTKAAESVLPEFRFAPAESKGKPVNYWVALPVAFKLG